MGKDNVKRTGRTGYNVESEGTVKENGVKQTAKELAKLFGRKK